MADVDVFLNEEWPALGDSEALEKQLEQCTVRKPCTLTLLWTKLLLEMAFIACIFHQHLFSKKESYQYSSSQFSKCSKEGRLIKG